MLSDLCILRGVPGHIRSDDGPEFVAKSVCEWIAAVGAKMAHIAPGSPWENGYIESFNAGPVPLRPLSRQSSKRAWSTPVEWSDSSVLASCRVRFDLLESYGRVR